MLSDRIIKLWTDYN